MVRSPPFPSRERRGAAALHTLLLFLASVRGAGRSGADGPEQARLPVSSEPEEQHAGRNARPALDLKRTPFGAVVLAARASPMRAQGVRQLGTDHLQMCRSRPGGKLGEGTVLPRSDYAQVAIHDHRRRRIAIQRKRLASLENPTEPPGGGGFAVLSRRGVGAVAGESHHAMVRPASFIQLEVFGHANRAVCGPMVSDRTSSTRRRTAAHREQPDHIPLLGGFR